MRNETTLEEQIKFIERNDDWKEPFIYFDLFLILLLLLTFFRVNDSVLGLELMNNVLDGSHLEYSHLAPT